MSDGLVRRRTPAVALAAVAAWSVAPNAAAQNGIPKRERS